MLRSFHLFLYLLRYTQVLTTSGVLERRSTPRKEEDFLRRMLPLLDWPEVLTTNEEDEFDEPEFPTEEHDSGGLLLW